MSNETVVPFEPALHSGVLVGAIIIHHHMQPDLAGKRRIQTLQKFQKLLVAMARITLTDALALRDFQGGEQRRRAVALVVVGHRSTATLLERQSWLRAVQ